jgi:hypothetical protein
MKIICDVKPDVTAEELEDLKTTIGRFYGIESVVDNDRNTCKNKCINFNPANGRYSIECYYCLRFCADEFELR